MKIKFEFYKDRSNIYLWSMLENAHLCKVPPSFVGFRLITGPHLFFVPHKTRAIHFWRVEKTFRFLSWYKRFNSSKKPAGDVTTFGHIGENLLNHHCAIRGKTSSFCCYVDHLAFTRCRKYPKYTVLIRLAKRFGGVCGSTWRYITDLLEVSSRSGIMAGCTTYSREMIQLTNFLFTKFCCKSSVLIFVKDGYRRDVHKRRPGKNF